MAGSSTASPPLGRAAIKARTLVLKQIKNDHKAFKSAWQSFEKHDLARQRAEVDDLVRRFIADLRFHSHFEQAHLYPAVNAGNDNRHRTELAEAEHHAIDSLLERLQSRRSGDDQFAALFQVVCEQTARHAKREEADIFPLLKDAPVDWPALANLIRQRDEPIEPTIPAVLQATPDDVLNPVASAPVDDTIEPPTVLATPDTPAERRAAARRAPIK